MKVRDQQRVDSERKTYVVTFPNEVDYKAVSAFVTSLAGLHRRHGLRGIPTYIFEVEADQRGITHRLGVPRGDEAFIISQLRTLIPSAHAVLEETRNRRPWMYAVELTLTDPKQSLRVDHPDTLVASLLAGFHPLKADESLLLQWVIAPNATQALPNQSKTTWPFGPMFISKEEIALQRKKLEDHTFVAVGRIAARGENEYTAKKLAQRLIIPLDSARTHGTRFRQRLVSQSALFGRVDSGSVTTLPIVFSTSELAALIAYPIGSPNVPGLPNGRSRHLPAATMIPREGIVAGLGNYPGAERPIALSPASLLMHEWVIAPTGQGKSTLLHNQAAQLMAQGHGLVLIEPKGDLATDVLASVPKERINDVIWFDPTDVANPIGLNVLSGHDPERTTGHVVTLMHNLYGESWGPRLEQILRYSVLTAAINGLTLYDVKQLLVNPDFRAKIVRATHDSDIRQFWARLDSGPENAVDSVVNKLDSFLGSRAIRNIIGQPKGLSMRQVLDKKKILIVPLPSGTLGDANGAMLGSLIVTLFWQEVRARPASKRDPFYLMLDEWQTYMNLAVSMDDLFAIARGLGLGLIVANQHTAQLKPAVLSAVNNNARTKIAFGLAPEDADKLRNQFPPFTSYDLQHLGQHEIVIQAMTPEGLAPAATATTFAPPRPTGYGEAARRASRAVYGRPVAEVEAELAERHAAPERSERPKFGRREQ